MDSKKTKQKQQQHPAPLYPTAQSPQHFRTNLATIKKLRATKNVERGKKKITASEQTGTTRPTRGEKKQTQIKVGLMSAALGERGREQGGGGAGGQQGAAAGRLCLVPPRQVRCQSRATGRGTPRRGHRAEQPGGAGLSRAGRGGVF